MKFINYLEDISGVEVYPMISLGIFFIFFIVLTVWALTVSRKHIEEMKNIPFDEKSNSNDSLFI